jgi:pimeloyl-ACP methyl ester carboxylesterase
MRRFAEEPSFVRSGDGDLLAITTAPLGASNGLTVVLLHAGGESTSIQRNRIWVRLARALAASGFEVVRYDTHGVGDSRGEIKEFRLDKPFSDDLHAICDWLATREARRFVFVGTCIGARAALQVARARPEVAGLVLMMTPVRDYAKGERSAAIVATTAEQTSTIRLIGRGFRWRRLLALRHARTRKIYRAAAAAKLRALMPGARTGSEAPWVSPLVEEGLKALADRAVPVLLIYGEQDVHYRDFQIAAAGRLATVVAPRSSVDVVVLPADTDMSGFPSLAMQATVMNTTTEWLTEHFAAPPVTPSSSRSAS